MSRLLLATFALPLVVLGCAQVLPQVLDLGGSTGPDTVSVAAPLPRRDLVDVHVQRELRGLWVATVSNLDFPSHQGLSADMQRQELTTLVDKASALGLNALVFQVRPEGDALYASALEPWSRFLTGKQGGDPGFDPLSFLVEAAHASGLEVHAWFNPYRAATSLKAPLAEAHLARRVTSAVHTWGSLLWLDPGVPAVRNHAVSVVGDVLERYDIDGVHLDDYFYPYPERGRSFPDDLSYRTYLSGGGDLERNAWRRENVDALVEGLAAVVHDRRPDVRFGISPFGIYRSGAPEGVRGLDQVAALHADPLEWYANGWVDYLAPQLYWPTTKQSQPFAKILTWWNDQVAADRPLLVGLDLTKVGNDPAWTLTELRTQVALSRAADATAGQIWFRATPVLADKAGLGGMFREVYAEPALPPVLPRFAAESVAPPDVQAVGTALVLAHPDAAEVRGYVLYRATADGWHTERILPPHTASVVPGAGTWAVSAVGRHGTESRGVRVAL